MSTPVSFLLDSDVNRRVVDGIRAIGIILVICFHVVVGLSSLLEDDALHRFIGSFSYLFNFAWQALGSEIIFLFSGFLLSYLLLRDLIRRGNIDIGNFYVRRLSRIIPLYLIALVLYWLVRDFGVTELNDLVMNFLFVSKLFGFTTIIPIGWSLEVLVQSYLLLPFLVLLLVRSKHPVKLTMAALTIALAARYLALYLDPPSYQVRVYEFFFGTEASETQQALYYRIYFRATPFLLGLLLAYLVTYKDQLMRSTFEHAWVPWMLVPASLALIIVSAFLPVHDQHSALYQLTNDQFWLWYWTLQRFVFASAICLLILCAWYGHSNLLLPLNWILQRSIWSSVSRNIYTIYLFHPVFLIPAAVVAFRTYKVEEIEPIFALEIVTIVVLVTILSNLFGKVMTRFVEAPSQRRIRERLEDFHWRKQA
jgi:peptidoglycan/LPS O-acetylase OafA/YrhL